jgi:multimeric flavodoxin WrbA
VLVVRLRGPTEYRHGPIESGHDAVGATECVIGFNTVKTLLVVCHSVTGGTLQMAEAAVKAASDPDVAVRMLNAAETTAEDLLAADGYIFASPENLAALTGVMKDFFDRTYYAVLERLNGRPYAALICAGSDGENAARQLARIATGWRLRPIAPPLIVRTHAQTPEAILAPKTIGLDDLRRCEEIGATFAAGLAAGIF